MKHPFFSRNGLLTLLVTATMLTCGLSCQQGGSKSQETTSRGTINISVDESFKPIIDSQIRVFEASFPEAKIIAHYKPEAECLRDLANDSIRMVIVTRELNREEIDYYKSSIGYVPAMGLLAYDAVTVIANNKSKDSIFSMTDLRAILSGSRSDLKVVMDGLSATSTVRYAVDSVLRGQPIGKNVVAAKSSQGVIDYVSNNADAIGFIGVSWIANPEDTTHLSFLQKVNIASLQCGICTNETYVKPYQANIATRRYPMVRGLHYIVKENFRGVGSGFVNFLQYERGQLIFRRAYLWPARMEF
ncbi:MAG TPA: substrate-binding domain-containing protein, partial [Chitinophagaceae bacterium]|nr:substrate-binding domain-containing protein [Chitinophagaceae bacterium]